MKWWHWVLISTGACLASFIAGRGSVRQVSTSVSVPSTHDGGVPEARAAVEVEKGTTTLSYSCKVEPPKPLIIRVPVPGKAPGECLQIECPPCPSVSCSGTATSETAPVHAETAAPLLPPTVVTVRETERRRIWGIGLSGFHAAGTTRPGGALTVSPWPWLDIHASGSTNGGELDFVIRP